MELGIRGRTAMVAAASKGLGRAIASALVAEGARVSICARSAGALAETEKALRAAGGEVLATAVDVSRPDELAHAVMFLLSERAAYITGTSLQVDGGLLGATF